MSQPTTSNNPFENNEYSFIDISDDNDETIKHRFQLSALCNGQLAAVSELQSQRLSPEHQLRLARYISKRNLHKNTSLASRLSRPNTAEILKECRYYLRLAHGVDKDKLYVIRPIPCVRDFEVRELSLKSPFDSLHRVMTLVHQGEYIMATPHRQRLAQHIIDKTIEHSKPKNRNAPRWMDTFKDRLKARKTRNREFPE